MAAECPQSNHNLHVLTDMRHMDILNDNLKPVCGKDEGVVHMTSFTNHIMPIVRYRLGDLAHWEGFCECGKPFPLVSRIKGRETEHLVDKFGRSFYSPNTPCLVKPNCLAGYQFAQHAPGIVTIRLVLCKEHPDFEQDFAYIKNFFEENWKGRFDYTYEFVDQIPHDGGKTRCIVQEPFGS